MKITKRAVMAMASFVLLLLQAFGLKIDVPVVNEIISALAGVLVMLGIISDSHTSVGSAGGSESDGDTDGADKTPTGGAGEIGGNTETPVDTTTDGTGETAAESAGAEGSTSGSGAEGDETDKNGAISGE